MKSKNNFIVGALVFSFAMVSFLCSAQDVEYEYIVCPGRGEKCVVSNSSGFSDPFNRTKGKDRGAIEIEIKK